MGKLLKKIWSYLNEKALVKFKKIVDRIGKFLITVLAASITFAEYVVGFIQIIPLREFIYTIYFAFAILMIACIAEIFRQNGYHTDTIESSEPQEGQIPNET